MMKFLVIAALLVQVRAVANDADSSEVDGAQMPFYPQYWGDMGNGMNMFPMYPQFQDQMNPTYRDQTFTMMPQPIDSTPQPSLRQDLTVEEDYPVDDSLECSDDCKCNTICVPWIPCDCMCPPRCIAVTTPIQTTTTTTPTRTTTRTTTRATTKPTTRPTTRMTYKAFTWSPTMYTTRQTYITTTEAANMPVRMECKCICAPCKLWAPCNPCPRICPCSGYY